MNEASQENKVQNTLTQEKPIDKAPDQPIHKKDDNQSNIENEKSNNNQSLSSSVQGNSEEDPNWKAFREARKKDRAEKEAAEKKAAEREAELSALKAAMEAAFSKNTPPQNQYYPEQRQYEEETEEQRIKRLVQEEVTARETASQKAMIEREHREYPNRLIQTYPDFQQTIAQENLDYLDYHYPEVSRPLQRLPEGFDRWSDIYKAVKKFVPNNATAKKEAAKAQTNLNKPKSMSTTGITQPGEGKPFTSMHDLEAKRASRYMEMQKIIKSMG